jgi:hypothetical protein
LLNSILSRITKGHYRYHLFVRARKSDRPFRWHFPDRLFDGGHLAFHMAPRDSSVTFGENEVIHIAMGWGELRMSADGAAYRRSGDVGDIYLLNNGPVSEARVLLANGKGEAQCWHDNGGALVHLGSAPFDAPAGRWTEVVIPVSSAYEPGNQLHVRLDAPGGVDVARVTTA